MIFKTVIINHMKIHINLKPLKCNLEVLIKSPKRKWGIMVFQILQNSKNKNILEFMQDMYETAVKFSLFLLYLIDEKVSIFRKQKRNIQKKGEYLTLPQEKTLNNPSMYAVFYGKLSL